MKTSLILLCLLSASAFASETQEYCNEMYPADSYDAQERNQYIAECMESYGDDSYEDSYDEPQEPTSSEEDSGYYDGTVEQFVDSIQDEQ